MPKHLLRPRWKSLIVQELLDSDQGRMFEGKVIHHFCAMIGINKSQTTVYHLEGDVIMERMNRTLISMLKSLDPVEKHCWIDHVAPCL